MSKIVIIRQNGINYCFKVSSGSNSDVPDTPDNPDIPDNPNINPNDPYIPDTTENPYIIINTGDDGYFAVTFFAYTTNNLVIDWGDGTQENIGNLSVDTTRSHVYSNHNATKKITFTGTSTGSQNLYSPFGQKQNYLSDVWQEKIISVGGNWDKLNVNSSWNYLFYNCTNLLEIAQDLFPQRAASENLLESCFENCTSLHILPDRFLNVLSSVTYSETGITGGTGGTGQQGINNNSQNTVGLTGTNGSSILKQSGLLKNCFKNCSSLNTISGEFLPNFATINLTATGGIGGTGGTGGDGRVNSGSTTDSGIYKGGRGGTGGTGGNVQIHFDLLEGCFENCTNLQSLPVNFLSSFSVQNNGYNGNSGAMGATGNSPSGYSGLGGMGGYGGAGGIGESNVRILYNTFKNCTSLQSVSSGFLSNVTVSGNLTHTIETLISAFEGCTQLQSLPVSFLPNIYTAGVNFLNSCFKNTAVQSIPAGFISGVTGTINSFFLYSCFENCTNLQNVWSGFLDNNINTASSLESCFSRMFYNCSGLSGNSPALANGTKLWERFNSTETNTIGENCFYNCTNLTDYNTIPENWK